MSVNVLVNPQACPYLVRPRLVLENSVLDKNFPLPASPKKPKSKRFPLANKT